MRKFKHKQTGNIAHEAKECYSIRDNNRVIMCFVPNDLIENTQDWIEIKKPVFTTADGVDMFVTNKQFTYKDNDLLFSTIKSAQEYLDFKAPKYSLCEIFGLYNKSIGRSNLIQQLKNLKK